MNLLQFVGMTIEEATAFAKNGGLSVRIQNVGLQPLNNDYDQGRINFKVVNGRVVSASIG